MNRIEILTLKLADGELSEPEARELDELLARDPAARTAHAGLLELEAALRGLRTLPDMSRAILGRIKSGHETDLSERVLRVLKSELKEELIRFPGAAGNGDQPRDAVVPPAPSRRKLPWPLAIAASAAALLGLGVLFYYPAMGEPVLTEVVGVARLERIGQPSPAAAFAGARFQPGDVLVTAANASAVIAFGGEPTRLSVGAGTTLGLASTRSGKRLHLRAGRLEADVARQRPFKPLTVTTPNAEATVVGTKFRVTSSANRTELEVVEGKVRLADTIRPGAKPVIIAASQRGVVAPDSLLAALPSAKGLLMERWTNVAGAYHVNFLRLDPRYPDQPSTRTNLANFEAPSNAGENFGARFRGYLHPPETGKYVFALAAWEGAELFLSRDDQPAHVVQIAYAAASGAREWDKHSGQQSSALTLAAGRRYYIEAIQKQSAGADHLSVAWKRPGGELEIIPGDFLSPVEIAK